MLEPLLTNAFIIKSPHPSPMSPPATDFSARNRSPAPIRGANRSRRTAGGFGPSRRLHPSAVATMALFPPKNPAPAPAPIPMPAAARPTTLSAEDIARARSIGSQIRGRFAQYPGRTGTIFADPLISTTLVAGGHILIESVPGLAKTTAAQTLATSVSGSFKRVQCTPDLMPSDLVGTQVFDFATQKFSTQIGPIHANFVLLDEINRSNAKTQSAMLEAMSEGATTIGGQRIALPKPFMVIATQNPIEEEGTFNLPEAQMDRFMMKAVTDLSDSATKRQRMLAMLDPPRLRYRSAPHAHHRRHAFPSVRRRIPAHRGTPRARVRRDHAVMRSISPPPPRGAGIQAPSKGLSIARCRLGASPRAVHRAWPASARPTRSCPGRDYVVPEDVEGVRPRGAAPPYSADVRGTGRWRRQRPGRRHDRRRRSPFHDRPDPFRRSDPQRKSRPLALTLSLPTVRKALGILEGAHASRQAFRRRRCRWISTPMSRETRQNVSIGRPAPARAAPWWCERERPSTSRAWLLLDVGQEMTGTCPSGEQAHQVAANALRMFAALSLRRGDEVSMVFGDQRSHHPRAVQRWTCAVRTNVGQGACTRDWDQAPQYRRVAGIRAPHSGQRGVGRHRHRGACVGGTAFERHPHDCKDTSDGAHRCGHHQSV